MGRYQRLAACVVAALLFAIGSDAAAQPVRPRRPAVPARPATQPPAPPLAPQAPVVSPQAAVQPSPTSLVQTRPIDRATVRIVALRGVSAEEAHGERTGQPRMIAVPDVAHGSGLAITADGLILTARHVAVDADVLAVLVPGQERPLDAIVVGVDPEHDVAFLRVHGPLRDFIPLPDSPTPLQTLQRVSATGYPLDVRERLPAAASGEVSRVNNDGRIQLSMSVNPGNSGGPVMDEQGRLVGVVSQGADPNHGAQGITLIEPVQVVLAARARIPATPAGVLNEAEQAARQEVAQLLADIVRAGPWGLVDDAAVHDRLVGLSQRTTQPHVKVLIAAHLWNILMLRLEQRGLLSADQLQGDEQIASHELMALMIRLCQEAQAQDPGIRQHYPFAHEVLSAVEAINAHTCGSEGQGCCYGNRCSPGLFCGPSLVCVAPRRCATERECNANEVCSYGACAPRPVPGRFHFQLRTALAWDDAPQASTVGGAVGGIGFTINVADFGPALVRVSPMVGAELHLGAWRSDVALDLSAHAGVAVSVGGRYRGVARLLYTPGFVFAETRPQFAYLSYRAEALFQLPSLAVGLSWQESQRAADSTLRLLGLLVEFGW